MANETITTTAPGVFPATTVSVADTTVRAIEANMLRLKAGDLLARRQKQRDTDTFNLLQTDKPIITVQPSWGAKITAPATKALTATVTGSPTPLLQWQRAEIASPTVFVDLAVGTGPTTASYTTPATVKATDNGAKWRLKAWNNAGTTYSDVVTGDFN